MQTHSKSIFPLDCLPTLTVNQTLKAGKKISMSLGNTLRLPSSLKTVVIIHMLL